MNLAQIIASSGSYLGLAFIPPIAWLLIYLQEDRHNEPLKLLTVTFIGGIASALVALLIQLFLFGTCASPTNHGCWLGVLPFYNPLFSIAVYPITSFLIIALTEEYFKYSSVKLLVLRNPEFNEPIDAMIYMVSAALGFAAIENALFLFLQIYDPHVVLGENLLAGAQLSVSRFIGANFLHALASAIVGYFLARAWFHPMRKHLIAFGVILAAILHAAFNYLIIQKDELIPSGIIYIVALLGLALVFVLIDFHKLKKENP